MPGTGSALDATIPEHEERAASDDDGYPGDGSGVPDLAVLRVLGQAPSFFRAAMARP